MAKKALPRGDVKNIMPTAAICMGDDHVVHSCGDCGVVVPMGSSGTAHRFYVMDTEAFDFVLGTDFFMEHSQILSLTLQAPYVLEVDHGEGGEPVPVEQSEHTSSYVGVQEGAPCEDGGLQNGGLSAPWGCPGPSSKGVWILQRRPEHGLVAGDKQHVLHLYCSKGQDCCYTFFWPSFGMAYGNPRFSEVGKVSTKVALERSRMVLCSPNRGAHGGNEYWRTLLEKLTLTSIQLPNDAIDVPLGRKTPIGKPGWGSILSVVTGGLAPVP